jgi:hypothetical protein
MLRLDRALRKDGCDGIALELETCAGAEDYGVAADIDGLLHDRAGEFVADSLYIDADDAFEIAQDSVI